MRILYFLYFFYQWLIFLPLFLVITILTALVTIVGSILGNGNFWGYYPGRIWSRLVCIFALLPVEVRGREHIDKDTSYIFVPNHQGYFDIFLIFGYLNHNLKWMMKKSLRKLPFVGYACECAGNIFVDDSGAKGVRSTILQARKVLRGGMSLVIFPEGSRTLDGKLHRFKKGAFQLADDIHLPIVPVTLEGPYQVMRRGTYLMKPHRLVMTIHKPIPYKEGPHEVTKRMEEARRVIAESLGEA